MFNYFGRLASHAVFFIALYFVVMTRQPLFLLLALCAAYIMVQLHKEVRRIRQNA